MPFIPHTEKDRQDMLKALKLPDLDALFDEIPAELLIQKPLELPQPLNEMDMMALAKTLAQHNNNQLCFIGAGSYDHYCPAAVWDIATRGEFLTTYTPYQAEASQGSLQLLFEFQTMIAELTGLAVANASLYDGASALAEAVLMASRIQDKSRSKKVLVTGGLHPHYLQTLKSIVSQQEIELITLPILDKKGVTDLSALHAYEDQKIMALVIAEPNFFGCLEPVDALTDWAQQQQIISIGSVNPISLALLKPPGEWGNHGVDIACGEGQPLGVPMASGGPYFGFFASRMDYVRQMPGRLIGQTLDKEGKIGYTLTLQAREQHIRRSKATSNICSNQGLLVTAATIYMSLMGPEGLAQVAERCHHNTHELVHRLCALPGVSLVFDAPYFHEAVLRFPCPAKKVLAFLQQQGIAGGYPVDEQNPNLHNTILVCATEKRAQADIERYVNAIQLLISQEGMGERHVDF